MKITTKFVLNRKGFRDQVLKDNGDAGVLSAIEPAVKAVAPTGTRVETSYGPSRLRVRIVDDSPDAAHNEAKYGALSQALNRIHL